MTFQRRRVLFVIPSLTGGGAERVFSILLRRLDRAQFELHLAVLQAKGPFMQVIPNDIVVHDLSVSRARYALPKLVSLIWRIRPQTVLSTLGHLNLLLIVAKPLLPRATRLVVREAAIASAVLVAETRHPGFWSYLYRHLYRRANAVVCLSNSMVEDMAVHFNVPLEKLVRIYNRVDVEQVQAAARMGESPYSGPGPHLLAAGRLTRQKGFDILLDALPEVLCSFPHARLTLLGEGPLTAELMAQAHRLRISEAVRFLGFQDNPWQFLKHADLFVFPSRYEGAPNILLEALALDTPIVACDCPGAVREVQECHGGILLVPPEDPAALAQSIICLSRRVPPRVERVHESNGSVSMLDVQQAINEYSRLLLA